MCLLKSVLHFLSSSRVILCCIHLATKLLEQRRVSRKDAHPPTLEVLSKNNLALSPRCVVYRHVHTRRALELLLDVRLLTEVSSVIYLVGLVQILLVNVFRFLHSGR